MRTSTVAIALPELLGPILDFQLSLTVRPSDFTFLSPYTSAAVVDESKTN